MTARCPAACAAPPVVTDVGTASGLRHFRCPACGVTWREKSSAAVELGAAGGRARAQRLSEPELSAAGAKAANARWQKEKDA